MNFKIWLEGLEEYEPYKKGVEDVVRGRTRSLDFPFESWWESGQDRLYIPFEHKVTEEESEKNIKEFMGDFKGITRVDSQGITRPVFPSATGYELVDYKAGLVRPIGSNRQFRVMPILTASLKEDLAVLDEKLSSGNISTDKYNNEKSMIDKHYNNLIQGFQNDPSRVKKNNFEIVISKNPHDLASMSTGRSWTSCMNLKAGSNKESVYCELKNGGFVAYLIRSEDKNIEHPLGRVHIRRFDRKKKGGIKSVAVPEETMYGLDVPEFLDKVQDWLDSKQGIIRGAYYRRGGSYSDTFGGNRRTVILPSNTSSEYLQKAFYKYLTFDDKKKNLKPNLDYIKAIVEMIMSDSALKFDDDFIMVFAKALAPQYYGPIYNNGLLGGLTKEFDNKGPHSINVIKLLIRFPEIAYKGIIGNYLNNNKRHFLTVDSVSLTDLFNKRPDLFTDEDLKKFDMKIDTWRLDRNDMKDISPISLEKLKGIVTDRASEKINIEKYDLEYFNKLNSQWDFYNDLIEFINKELGILRPIPPSVARKFVALFDNREKIWTNIRNSKLNFKNDRDKEGFISDMNYHLFSSFFSALNSSKTDSPIVLNWIDSILPNIDQYVGKFNRGIDIVAYYLSTLGRDNGLRFLPTLKKQKEEYEQKLKTSDDKINAVALNRIIEKYNYIIDSIETNSPSTKHTLW